MPEVVVDILRPARVVVGTGLIPATVRRRLAESPGSVPPRTVGIAPPVDPESRQREDGDNADRNSDDQEGAHDADDGAVHRCIPPRGRKCEPEPPKPVSRLARRAAALGAALESENSRSSFRTATATIATTPSATPPKKTAIIMYATDAALPLMAASPHPADGAEHRRALLLAAPEILREPGWAIVGPLAAHTIWSTGLRRTIGLVGVV